MNDAGAEMLYVVVLVGFRFGRVDVISAVQAFGGLDRVMHRLIVYGKRCMQSEKGAQLRVFFFIAAFYEIDVFFDAFLSYLFAVAV
ncbi:MAG: hypothetical protein ACD_47C00363G0002 [uncultured bacterium]|nr:MAG: hypothetical protein ACD_47C00363G0002 [uncultured bacterium]